MANMCSNVVVFTGDPAAVENVKALFKEIEQKQNETGKWHLPPYVTANFSHMQDISMDNEKINYETRWYPNLQGLVQIADHFQLDFVNHYDEVANGVFGEASYTKGTLLDICLDPADFQAYDFDPATRLFTYNGQTYENETPIFEKMIEEKKADNPYFKTTSEVTKEELAELYGELLPGDIVLKFAEHKNFVKANEAFRDMDEGTIAEIDRVLSGNPHTLENYKSQDQFLAVSFLKLLISEWNKQHRSTQFQADRGL